jgi:non-ribosomal peptide synthase protein (TIGR01720 family)
VGRSHDLSFLVKSTKEMLRRVPRKGVGYGMLGYPALKLRPQVSFNYLGQFDQDIDRELFRLSPLGSGPSVSPGGEREYSLEIYGMIVDKRLSLSLGYHQDEYSPASISRWLDSYKRNLLRIIDHCAAKERSEATAADFGIHDVSVERFDELVQEIAQLEVSV